MLFTIMLLLPLAIAPPKAPGKDVEVGYTGRYYGAAENEAAEVGARYGNYGTAEGEAVGFNRNKLGRSGPQESNAAAAEVGATGRYYGTAKSEAAAVEVGARYGHYGTAENEAAEVGTRYGHYGTSEGEAVGFNRNKLGRSGPQESNAAAAEVGARYGHYGTAESEAADAEKSLGGYGGLPFSRGDADETVGRGFGKPMPRQEEAVGSKENATFRGHLMIFVIFVALSAIAGFYIGFRSGNARKNDAYEVLKNDKSQIEFSSYDTIMKQ